MPDGPDGGDRAGIVIPVGGHRLHVIDEGEGLSVLLMAALGSNWFDLDALTVRLLRQGFRVIRYDRPGYGLSSPRPPDEMPGLLDEVDRMRMVLDAVGVGGPVLIVGHSLASLYVEAFGRVYPERSAGLVMVDGSFVLAPWRVVPARWGVRAAHRAVRVAQSVTAAMGVHRWPSAGVWTLVVPPPPEGFTDDQRRWAGRVFGQPRFMTALLAENAVFATMDRDLRDLRRTHQLPDVPIDVVVASPRMPGWRHFWEWKQRRYAQTLITAAGVEAHVDVISPARHFVVSQRPDEVAAIIGRMAGG
ncbi:alpha/beta hydrolase [Gordonia sp. Z-3]|jgi:pimeloyl-ACP methyl ester carboxylesterase|uniref:Alpha/beta hydrolase n=2 Tax=Gordonia TaxID=2053 RepID=A0A9X3D8I8_9ACTN|nr:MULTISPECIES: alpha/beta hydrolase [Gordonia]MAU84876.1 alpha/beta hydrolase [Gordonia sp. (in: high G+C Gram-positive bacteria)]MCF3940843.1 alpha/beta hydrolase [Gordonia tangerina]MCX2965959.1 alpha/beta hydrolase [Gordonia aquimaris]MED5803814.1 alpha/beta hydrolase [Gordonia sp. Z-3]